VFQINFTTPGQHTDQNGEQNKIKIAFL